MLVIHPDECINCGVREPECPAEAIFPGIKPNLGNANEFDGAADKLEQYFSPHPGQGDQAARRQADVMTCFKDRSRPRGDLMSHVTASDSRIADSEFGFASSAYIYASNRRLRKVSEAMERPFTYCFRAHVRRSRAPSSRVDVDGFGDD
jgi:ferredoxin